MSNQRTLCGVVEVEGIGFHSGASVRTRLWPARANSGIVISVGEVYIPVHPAHVVRTPMATTLAAMGERVQTVEHLLSAIHGLGIDNLRIEVDGGEVPILDGCGAEWSDAIGSVGMIEQDAPARVLQILRTVEVRDGKRWARLEPADGLEIDLTIEFDHASIGRQRLSVTNSHGMYKRELAWARPFGLARRVPAMHRLGLVRGGSLDNAVVFDDDGPINPGGLRSPDEPVRHKILDAIGNLTLLGPRLNGRLVAEWPGDGLIVSLARAVAERPESWTMRSAEA